MSQKPDRSYEMPHTFWETLHRAVVIFDDYLCTEFGLSRRPRGKYEPRKTRGKPPWTSMDVPDAPLPDNPPPPHPPKA